MLTSDVVCKDLLLSLWPCQSKSRKCSVGYQGKCLYQDRFCLTIVYQQYFIIQSSFHFSPFVSYHPVFLVCWNYFFCHDGLATLCDTLTVGCSHLVNYRFGDNWIVWSLFNPLSLFCLLVADAISIGNIGALGKIAHFSILLLFLKTVLML